MNVGRKWETVEWHSVADSITPIGQVNIYADL